MRSKIKISCFRLEQLLLGLINILTIISSSKTFYPTFYILISIKSTFCLSLVINIQIETLFSFLDNIWWQLKEPVSIVSFVLDAILFFTDCLMIVLPLFSVFQCDQDMDSA